MKTYLMALATVVALSISYYFVVALPANNKARLDFEREKYRNEQAEIKAKQLAQEQDRAQNQKGLAGCLADAEKAFDHDVALNGAKNSNGSYSVDSGIAAMIARRRTEARTECHKEFGL